MTKVFYTSGSTYIDDLLYEDRTIRCDNLSFEEEMVLSIKLNCEFDYEDITSEEEEKALNILIENKAITLSKVLDLLER